MERMPAEIIKMIAQDVAYPEGEHIREYEVGRTSTMVYPNADLKALRLSSKAIFSKAATDLLFSDVHVYMNASSFARLTAIAEHAEVSQLVRHVAVFPKYDYSTCSTRADYESHVNYDYGGLYRRYRKIDDYQGTPVFSVGQKNEGFLHYRQLRDEYKELEPKIPWLLRRAFTSFGRLQMVTLGFYDDEMDYPDSEALPTLAPAALDFHRKTLLPFNGYQGDRDLEGDMHVLRAASMCRPKIECLNLYTQHRGLDFGMLQLSNEDYATVLDLLANVSTLAFLLSSTSTHKCLRDQPFQFLRSAINVKHLSLRGNEISWADDPFAYNTRRAHFPHLQSLSLDLFACDSADLISLVQRHSSTLESLELWYILISSQSWYDVFTAIRGEVDNLFGTFCMRIYNTLRLEKLMGNPRAVWYLRRGVLLNRDFYFVNEPNVATLIHLLEDYVCNDEVWSDMLPIGLMRNASERDEVDDEVDDD